MLSASKKCVIKGTDPGVSRCRDRIRRMHSSGQCRSGAERCLPDRTSLPQSACSSSRLSPRSFRTYSESQGRTSLPSPSLRQSCTTGGTFSPMPCYVIIVYVYSADNGSRSMADRQHLRSSQIPSGSAGWRYPRDRVLQRGCGGPSTGCSRCCSLVGRYCLSSSFSWTPDRLREQTAAQVTASHKRAATASYVATGCGLRGGVGQRLLQCSATRRSPSRLARPTVLRVQHRPR